LTIVQVAGAVEKVALSAPTMMMAKVSSGSKRRRR
jgi:hypothetical protein